MSKHAATISNGVARLVRAVPLRTLVAVVVAALVVAAVAIPRSRAAISRAAISCASAETASAPVVVQVLAPQLVTPSPIELPSPTEPPSALAIATPVEERTDTTDAGDRTVSDPLPSAPVKAERRASKEKVSEEHVVRNWNGDWQAATAHLGSNRVEASAATAANVAPASTANPSSAATSDATAPALITISGCFEMSIDGETFRLADTEGANVPKVRTWRSGFLKKQAVPVELLELGDRAAARTYVGQRVTATGVVENREMRVRSLRTSGPCD